MVIFTSVLVSAQSITFTPKASFTSAEIERNGLSQALDPASENGVLYDANYGSVSTGNTLSRCGFIATMQAAFDGGIGGVYGFDTPAENHGNYGEIVLQTATAGTVTIVPGANNYPEGGCDSGYKGKECGPNFDGMGPSPNAIAPDTNLFNIGTSSSKEFIGDSFLGGSTSFDLVFDRADQVSVIGFAFLNYNNFQSYQRGNSDYPNQHCRVTWSNGVDADITHMACQYSSQNGSVDVYFGFRQPSAGYYLTRVEFYTIGNSARCWIGADEMGIAVGDGAAIEEEDIRLAVAPSGDNQLQLTVPARTDCMYQLHSNPDLDPANWASEGEPRLNSSDTDTETWTIAKPEAGEGRFYRVERP